MDDADNIEVLVERRKHPPCITEAVIEQIAERAAEKAVLKMETRAYQYVGKTFINRITQFIGALIVAFALYLHSKGFFNINGN